MIPDIEVSRDIAASPAAVFAALTDITRMGEWSPENYRSEWNEGYDHAEVGAEHTGHNRNGDKEWTTMSRIVELVQLRYFVGLTIPEAAAVLDIAPRTADAWWAYARGWLGEELKK